MVADDLGLGEIPAAGASALPMPNIVKVRLNDVHQPGLHGIENQAVGGERFPAGDGGATTNAGANRLHHCPQVYIVFTSFGAFKTET